MAFSLVENITAPNIPDIEATSYVPVSLVSFIRTLATPNDSDVMLVNSHVTHQHSVSVCLSTVIFICCVCSTGVSFIRYYRIMSNVACSESS